MRSVFNVIRNNGHWILLCAILFAMQLMLHRDLLDTMLRHGNDPLGYYQFLPGAFIDHDLREMTWAYVLDNGSKLSLFTIGVAILQLPFFLLGHLLAMLAGAPLTGYSWPYALFHLLSAAVYGTGGLALLASAMRRQHTQLAAAIALALLLLGTNLLYYIVREPGMSHVYSFFLFAWLWHITFRGEGLRWFLSLSVCGALIVLVRPLNGVALLLPLVLRYSSLVTLLRRAGSRPFILGVAVVLVIIAPQLLYWHMITGKWVLFTYGVKGEHFEFTKAMLGAVLFSHRNGWFMYSPLLLVAWGVLIWQAVRGESRARAVLLVWVLLWYGYASWWAWWLGAAYGFRGFVDISAWGAPALAIAVDRVRAWPRVPRSMATAATCFFVLLNLRMIQLYACCWDGPNWTWSSLIAIWREALWLS